MSDVVAPVFRRRTGFLLATLGRRTETAWSSFLRGQSISNAEFSALGVLVDESPVQGELAAYLAIDPRNAGALVRKLEARGWVDSQAHPGDARRRVIVITDQGRSAWSSIQAELSFARADYFDALESHERVELERLLNKLNDAHL